MTFEQSFVRSVSDRWNQHLEDAALVLALNGGGTLIYATPPFRISSGKVTFTEIISVPAALPRPEDLPDPRIEYTIQPLPNVKSLF